MELSSASFWLDRFLLLATTYIIIAYVFSPSSNKCQMTFMMEPPTFVQVPIDSLHHDKNSPIEQPNFNKYKLYMYSEIGFPQLSNVQRDFRDSMPVLFIPGNAGSYQQVRSLASTCIRHQLQSLNSYKFIFYTIDFNEELSGISGQLIEEETKFVHAALKQIAKIHPEDTGGIIVIGHSVGGFVSKNLFTLPDFDPDSVPLVISLASPLNQPYLTFDDEMGVIYSKANLVWQKEVSQRNNTISISISGGKSDKLVPMHLSMDPTYDLSLTTSAIKGVWLETDHVCITWCRELMHKLSNLLSSLMDKRHTHLIKNKKEALEIIKNQLLTYDKPQALRNQNVILTRDWKSRKPHRVVELNTFKQLTRSQLSDNIVVLKTDRLLGTDLLITIDHINDITPGRVFKCINLYIGSDDIQLNCSRRIDLVDFSYPLATRRFDPKRTAIKVDLAKLESEETIVFDFYDQLDKNYDLSNRLPELISIQEIHPEQEETLYIPTLLELVINKVLLMESYKYEIEGPIKASTILTRYRLVNLIDDSQMFLMELESYDCKDEYPNHSAILLYQGDYLSQSFHPRETAGKNMKQNKEYSFKFNFRLQQSVTMKHQTDNQDYFLDIYMDGTCKNHLSLSPDFAGIATLSLQRNLNRILALNSYIILVSIVDSTLDLSNTVVSKKCPSSNGRALKLTGFLLVYFQQELTSLEYSPTVNQLILFVSISVLSYGIVALLRHFFYQLVNLTIILYNIQSFIRRRLVSTNSSLKKSTDLPDNQSNSTSGPPINLEVSKSKFNHIDWILMTLSVIGSMLLSVAFTYTTQLLFVIRTNLIFGSFRASLNDTKKHHLKNTQQLEDTLNSKSNLLAQNLLANLAAFCSLAFISSIPQTLIRFKAGQLNLLESFFEFKFQELPIVMTTISLILIKSICDRLIGTELTTTLEPGIGSEMGMIKILILMIGKLGYFLILIPILHIESNIAHIRMALTSTLAWLYLRLLFIEHQNKSATNGKKGKEYNRHVR